jgi:endogenous inhibitor of DNA gyrase (YacG/DUF329 family)
MVKRSSKVRCPICKKPVLTAAPDFPFCSERCRAIDLGKWASGQYVVSSPLRDTDEDFELEPERGNSDEE